MALGRPAVVASLGSAQTLAWASSYYLPAVLAAPMARDLGVSTPTLFAAFSASLVVAALVGPRVGRTIDRRGGRPILMAGNVVFALGLAGLGLAQGTVGAFLAWVVLGVAMGAGLYEAAFSTLVHLYGAQARRAITGITLIAGFASTVGWPLTLWLETQLGWRGACFAWAALHVWVGVPLNALLPREPAREHSPVVRPPAPAAQAVPTVRTVIALSLVFSITAFISTAMAAHLPRVLEAAGVSLAAAVLVAALIGPAQVAARLLEFGLLRHVHPLWSARLAASMHPVGAAALAIFGVPAAAVFGVLHGAGNGILTIAKGTLPLALFGAEGYGRRQGMLMLPARMAQALSPWLFGICLDRWGAGALALSAGLGLLAAGVLALMRVPPAGVVRTQERGPQAP